MINFTLQRREFPIHSSHLQIEYKVYVSLVTEYIYLAGPLAVLSISKRTLQSWHKPHGQLIKLSPAFLFNLQ